MDTNVTVTLPLAGALEAAERHICETALQRHGTIVEAAEALGVTRHALKRRLVKHNIAHESKRGGWRPRADKRAA